MKKVRGFLSDDGQTFFETEQQCELFDAENELRKRSDDINVKPDRLVEIVRQLLPEITRYAKAIEADQDHRDKEQKPAPV